MRRVLTWPLRSRCRPVPESRLGGAGGSRLTVLRRLPLGVQGASVLGTRARARSRPSVHHPSFQRRCRRPANQRGAWGSRVSPTRPRGALRSRGVRSWCEDAAPAAPAAPGRAPPPRASGYPRAQALSVYVLFFSVCTLTSFTFLFFFFFPSPLLSCILFLQKQTQGAPSGRRVSPGELFLCLVVAVVAAARRTSSRSHAPPPPGEASALRCSGRLLETQARPLCACPVAQSPRCRAGAAPGSAAARGRPAPGKLGDRTAGELRVLSGGLAEGGRLIAQPCHTCPHWCPWSTAFVGQFCCGSLLN